MRCPLLFLTALAIILVAGLATTASRPAEAAFPGMNGKIAFTSNRDGGAWVPGAPYPTAIGRYAFAQTGQDLYVISGVSDGTIVNTVNRYNATTNTWTSPHADPGGQGSPLCRVLQRQDLHRRRLFGRSHEQPVHLRYRDEHLDGGRQHARPDHGLRSRRAQRQGVRGSR